MQLKNKKFSLTKNESFDAKCLQANLSNDGDIFGAEFCTSICIFYEYLKIFMEYYLLKPLTIELTENTNLLLLR